MSQKQAKGRKKGGDNNIKDIGNEWEGKGSRKCGWSVEMMNVMYGCKLKHQMGEKDEFRCGVCMVKEMMKLKREIDDLKTKMAYEEYR